ncbi:ATP-binding protein [Porticoccus sp. W117]|uniref:ATP-binding protein n=1 Tax=Porticoccus sp. W117 TaxID=3054777 RepID=UPI0025938D7D|nr:ATP-binding protein [Porticoccus sp. W117]MDM3870322.1 ATP-binding protein [Porticoccus sp. W117]
MTAWLHSLAGRFVLASLLLLPLFLGLSGLALERSFRHSQESALEEQLKSTVYLLMGAAELEGEQLWMPEQLTEPRLNQLNSGLLATIGDNQQVLWQSASSLATTLPPSTNSLRTGQQQFQKPASDEQRYYQFHYDVSWQQASGDSRQLRFSVAQDRTPMHTQLSAYRQQLWQWLGGLGLFLLAIQLLIMRWGLQPLRRVAEDLQAIEQGEQQQLQGNYPREITPVTENLNRVLESQHQQRERYRNTMADLAHSLKTPLAVMRGQLQGDGSDVDMDQQLERMDQIVRHQLQRAVGGSSASHQLLPVEPVVQRLVSTLEKIYQSSDIQFTTELDTNCQFRGDEADLMELLGNLLDNACKYGAGKVTVGAELDGKRLQLTVDDNGSGVPPQQRQAILQRGTRADTSQAGQGIGLAVVLDIVSGYGGELHIEPSPLGGARFRVVLPI